MENKPLPAMDDKENIAFEIEDNKKPGNKRKILRKKMYIPRSMAKPSMKIFCYGFAGVLGGLILVGVLIAIFVGIFNVAQTNDQFAAVIGHEIAHVTQDHMVERINRAQVTGGAISVTSILVGDQIGLGTADTQALLESTAQLVMLLPFGRKQESEADLVGLDLMASAGFDPRASIQLWKNMADAAEGVPPEFLSTHPSSDTRIDDLNKYMPEALIYYNQAIASGKQPSCQRD